MQLPIVRKVGGYVDTDPGTPLHIEHGDPLPEGFQVTGYSLYCREDVLIPNQPNDYWLCWHRELKDSESAKSAIQHGMEIQMSADKLRARSKAA